MLFCDVQMCRWPAHFVYSGGNDRSIASWHLCNIGGLRTPSCVGLHALEVGEAAMSDLRGARSRFWKGAVLLIATDIPEERDCLCKLGASWGLRARVISCKAFPRSMGDETDVVMRIGPYGPEARRALRPRRDGTATIFICESPWERACRGLISRADLYFICRPFATSELLWRAERALWWVREFRDSRRSLRVGSMCYDLNLCEVRVGTALVDFRRAEREIVVYLLRHPHRYVTTAELQDAVLRSHGNGGAVRTQIYEIRRKLALVGVPDAIVCEPQKGYRLLAAADVG